MTTNQRGDRIAEQRQRLEKATAQLLTTDGWRSWLRARVAFRTYSLNNQLLIAQQRPDATDVAGFRTWLALDRCVRRGERAIRIYAPMILRPVDDEEEEASRVIFRAVSVFDISQTDPLPGRNPAPVEPPEVAPVCGDSHAHLMAPLAALVASLGYSYQVTPAMPVGVDGSCDQARREIRLSAALSKNGQVVVFMHEIAHAHGVTYRDFTRVEAEIIAETAAAVAAASLGLDTIEQAAGYIAGWGGDKTPEHMRKAAGEIDRIAHRIESAVMSEADASGGAQAAA